MNSLQELALHKRMVLLLQLGNRWGNNNYLSRRSSLLNWAASSEFGTYRLCKQRRFRRACASAQSRQNLRYSLIQAASQEEPSDRKPNPWPLWMAGHAQLKFVMTECSKTQIRLTRSNFDFNPRIKRTLVKLKNCHTCKQTATNMLEILNSDIFMWFYAFCMQTSLLHILVESSRFNTSLFFLTFILAWFMLHLQNNLEEKI